MLVKPLISDGGINRQISAGDTVAGVEIYPATVVTTAITVTGQQLLAGLIARNPAAPATDTIDTAANIVAAISAGLGLTGIQPGTTFRCLWQVTTANALTVTATANTGVTVTLPTVNASSAKTFLVTIVNGTPAQVITGNTTNASAVITSMSAAETALLSVGMVVTNAVNGLQGAKILSVQPGIGVTLDTNANATSTSEVAINFSPVVTLQGLGQGLI